MLLEYDLYYFLPGPVEEIIETGIQNNLQCMQWHNEHTKEARLASLYCDADSIILFLPPIPVLLSSPPSKSCLNIS